MDIEKAERNAAAFAEPYRIKHPHRFRLKDHDPADTRGFKDKEAARNALEVGVNILSSLQEKLYAQSSYSLLLIFQAMDAAGKDGTIKHVLSGVNPQGCDVVSFKSPSSLDLNHDYLWRCMCNLPERGRIGIFNRSYYEETLAVRVHPEFLAHQKIPAPLVGKKIWKERFEDINAYEKYLTRNGVVIRKFFLHLSKAEQKRRFLSRLEDPSKNWKFSSADVRERQYWSEYQTAYEETIRATSTKDAPWFVVPADNKWFTRLVVAAAVIEALQSMNLKFPTVDDTAKKALAAAHRSLLAEKK